MGEPKSSEVPGQQGRPEPAVPVQPLTGAQGPHELNWYNQPIVDAPILQSLNLGKEIRVSELSLPQIESLKASSGGVLTLYEFAEKWSQRAANAEQGRQGYALGLTNEREFYRAATTAYGLYHWDEGFNLHGIRPGSDNFVDRYLAAITATGKPIVFFVPQNIFSFPSADITRREMEWFLDNPDKAANTQFVLGLYSVMDLQTYLTTLPKSVDTRITRLAQVLQNPQQFQPGE